MYVIKDVINNVFFAKVNRMGNIETVAVQPKCYSLLQKAKDDLKMLRKIDYVKKRSWKIIELER